MLITWRAYVLPNFIFILILILSWCRVTLVCAIWRHITIFDVKRLAANIIFFETKDP